MCVVRCQKRSGHEKTERNYDNEGWIDAEDGSDSDETEDVYGVIALDREDERNSW